MIETILTILFAVLGFYVLFSSAGWVVGSFRFLLDREGDGSDGFYDIPDEDLPSITALVPAYCEEKSIGACLDALAAADYPKLEIVAINDGSTDTTAGVIRSRLGTSPRLRFIDKAENEGKAMAMNDALAVSSGDVVVVVDADAEIHPEALRFIAAHFVRIPRMGGVTGNPRPSNQGRLITELQVAEYASHISLMRRSQVVWGRILTVSGVVSAFRRSVLADVGVFDPTMATEDIELTWRVQRRFYDVRYEPRAVLGMQVPATLPALVHQRMRWGRGLVQVLKRNRDIITHWKNRRHWPVFLEAIGSLVWWHLLVILVVLGVAFEAIGDLPVYDVTPLPWGWIATVFTAAVIQLTLGVLIDRRYDRTATSALSVVPWYPTIYWLFVGLVSTMVTIPTLLTRNRTNNVRWRVDR